MKNPIIRTSLALLFAGLTLSGFAQSNTFTLRGTVNVSSGVVYLKYFKNKTFYTQDSARIENGKFQFRGSVKRPDLYGVTLDRNENFSPYYIFLENKPITIAIDTANHRSAQIAGSESNAIFERYKKEKSRGVRIDSLIRAYPASAVPAYILYREYVAVLTPDEIEKNLTLFAPSVQDISYIRELREIIKVRKRVSVGNQSLDFAGTTPDGRTIRLSDYKGKYVLLDFWASWCPSCREENPNLVRLYEKFHSKGLNIFGVSLDKNKANWVTAIEKDRLTWEHVSDLKFWDSEPAKLYAIRVIPSNVLIDPSGKIIGLNLLGEDLENKLDQLFR